MPSKTEHRHVATTSPVQIDFAVKPTAMTKAVTVDGPIIEADDSLSERAVCASESGGSRISEDLTLGSPFCSPKAAMDSGLSGTSFDDSEAEGDKPGSTKDAESKSAVGMNEVVKLDDAVVVRVEVEKVAESNSNEGNASVTGDYKDNVEDSTAVRNGIRKADTISQHVQPAMIGLPPSPCDRPQSIQETTTPSKLTLVTDPKVVESDGGATVIENSRQIQPARCVPPHLRQDFQVPAARQPGLQELQPPTPTPLPSRYNDFPRAPRQTYSQNTINNYRTDGGRPEEVVRLNALLMKTRNELDAECKKSANMRKTVEVEKEKEMDKALAAMTIELVKKQAKALAHQAKVEAKERELEYRQARIEQLEIYLSEGQKQVYRYNKGLDGRPTMVDVEREHDRRQAELMAQKSVADVQAKMAYHQQVLQQRESALTMREQQYKTLIHSRFEAELLQRGMPDMEAKLNEVSDMEYNRGFGAGKVVGRAEAEEEAVQRGFLEGYDVCYRAQITLSRMRQGLIPRDSAELDFVYDSAHPYNLFTLGARVGGADFKKEKVQNKKEEPIVQEKVEDSVAQKRVEEPVVQTKPEQHIRRPVPPSRRTFASELRGAQSMHNGQFVLANGSGSSSPGVSIEVKGASGSNGGPVPARMVEEMNKGRPIVREEEEEKGEKERNLIDLE